MTAAYSAADRSGNAWSREESFRRPPENREQPETLRNFSPGDQFADYTLRQLCGRGAYGEVYLAEDLSGKTVAIKVVPIQPGDETWHLELIGLRYFRQNMDLHPALVTIFHVGESEDCFYYTMEAADNLATQSGEYLPDTLAERIARGPLPPHRILQVAHAMLDALEALNRHKLMHRDLKPGNILFVKGKPKLSDFGLMTRVDEEIGDFGTKAYLPPEIVSGKVQGTAGNDLYALGKVLYCCLTGLPASHYPEIPLSIPYSTWRQLRPVIQQACSDNPAERFYSPEDFRAALPRTIRRRRWYDRGFDLLRRQKENHPQLFHTSLASLLLLGSALVLGGAFYWHATRQQERNALRRTEYVFSVIQDLNGRYPHLARCAEASGRRSRLLSLERLAESAVEMRALGQLEEAERRCDQVQQQLRRWAEADLAALLRRTPPPHDPETLPQTQLRQTLDAYLQFREMPQFRWLPEKDAVPLNDEILKLQGILTSRSFGPVPGQDYIPGKDLQMRMVYVSPGLLPGEPHQAYWIAVNELTVHSARQLLGEAPFAGQEPLLPATGFCWNDALTITTRLTERDQAAGVLPEGYVYRLPTAAEWQFAALGGWRAPATGGPLFTDPARFAWFSGNSDCRVHAVRALQPNPLGLYDAFGNVAELTTEAPLPSIPCFGRGGDFRTRSFRQPERACYDKGLPLPKWCGLRLVLAPGSSDAFGQCWYRGQARVRTRNGSRFELLGGKGTALTGRQAREWAAMLGGRLALLKTPGAVQRYATSPNQLTRRACWIGGASDGSGNWTWNDGDPITTGSWLEPPPATGRQHLLLDGEFWLAAPDSPQATASLLLVEWSGIGERAPVIRPDFSRPPFSALLQIGQRRVALLSGQADWYTCKRVAELLHARLWVPASQQELDEAASQLSGHSRERLALGGWHTPDGWFWLDGRMMDSARRDPEWPDATGINQRFAALHQGALFTTGHFDGALLELPPEQP